jgi:hypothetical protein
MQAAKAWAVHSGWERPRDRIESQRQPRRKEAADAAGARSWSRVIATVQQARMFDAPQGGAATGDTQPSQVGQGLHTG